MMKSKMKSDTGGSFAKGGSNKMAGKSGAAPAVAGTISLGGRASGNDFPKGGSNKMAKQTNVAPSQPGKVSSAPAGGDNTFAAKGGGKAMAGFTGSTPAKPR